jgi:prepilin peptidase CpaA
MIALPDISLVAVLGFAGLLVAAAISDVRSLIIPNRYCLAIGLLYPAHILSTGAGADWIGAIAICGVLLVVGFLLHVGKIIGGGDAKLATAVALWAGTELFVEFLVITGITGGAMALALWLRHRLSRAASAGAFFFTPPDPDFVKQPMPYAVAIAAGGLYVAFTLTG